MKKNDADEFIRGCFWVIEKLGEDIKNAKTEEEKEQLAVVRKKVGEKLVAVTGVDKYGN